MINSRLSARLCVIFHILTCVVLCFFPMLPITCRSWFGVRYLSTSIQLHALVPAVCFPLLLHVGLSGHWLAGKSWITNFISLDCWPAVVYHQQCMNYICLVSATIFLRATHGLNSVYPSMTTMDNVPSLRLPPPTLYLALALLNGKLDWTLSMNIRRLETLDSRSIQVSTEVPIFLHPE